LQPIEVTFSHAGTGPTTIGDVHAASGQIVKIKVTDTNTHCFTFNPTVVSNPQIARALESKGLSANETVEFDLEMRDDPLEVTIEARKGSDPQCDTLGLSERLTGKQPPPWKVRILREGWDVAFAGAYTADTVTNPVFGLVAGQKQIDPAPAAKTAGFFVKSFPKQEDAYRLGAAAMVHVFHTSPSAFSWHDISWTPVSFGLGVGEASQVRYFLGSGVRFGSKFFLTGGVVVGSVKTLPAGLIANNADDPAGFTTNANALGAMGSKTRAGAFVGVSYTFAGVGPSSFTGPFTAVQPAVAGVQSTAADFSLSSQPSEVSVIQTQSVDSIITVSFSGNFKDEVTLSAKDLPTDMTAKFEQPTLKATGISKITLTTKATTPIRPEPYTVTVTGTGGDKARWTTIKVKVTKTTE